jgi:hypothetical protein
MSDFCQKSVESAPARIVGPFGLGRAHLGGAPDPLCDMLMVQFLQGTCHAVSGADNNDTEFFDPRQYLMTFSITFFQNPSPNKSRAVCNIRT